MGGGVDGTNLAVPKPDGVEDVRPRACKLPPAAAGETGSKPR